ncbi:MAG: 50S ribosomal protein L31e [Candidatus Bathyarchaeia archaeon]
MSEEAEKKKVLKDEKEEEDIVEDRTYVIPLGGAWASPRKRRSPRAVRILKEFISRHMKTDSIIIDENVNKKIWERGIEKPPRSIRVRATKNREGVVTLRLAEGK